MSHVKKNDATETLGSIIDETAGRDAIHVAVEPAVASHFLRPGDHVGFRSDGRAGLTEKPVGIVDPFLKGNVCPGQRFWLFVYPRTITGLRHVWEHPDIPVVPAPSCLPDNTERTGLVQRSIARIGEIADSFDVTYQELMGAAEDFLLTGEYWNEGERFEGEYLPESFWGHYEIVTGKTVPEDKQHSFFSCSC